jgi:hypothetical protein
MLKFVVTGAILALMTAGASAISFPSIDSLTENGSYQLVENSGSIGLVSGVFDTVVNIDAFNDPIYRYRDEESFYLESL